MPIISAYVIIFILGIQLIKGSNRNKKDATKFLDCLLEIKAASPLSTVEGSSDLHWKLLMPYFYYAVAVMHLSCPQCFETHGIPGILWLWGITSAMCTWDAMPGNLHVLHILLFIFFYHFGVLLWTTSSVIKLLWISRWEHQSKHGYNNMMKYLS